MKEEVQVLGYRPWQFVDEKTGEQKRGVSVHYVPVTPVSDDGNGGVGLFPVKLTAPIDCLRVLAANKVPGPFVLDLHIKPTKTGVSMKLLGLTPVAAGK